MLLPKRAGTWDTSITELVSLSWGHLQGPSSLLGTPSQQSQALPGAHWLPMFLVLLVPTYCAASFFHSKSPTLLEMGTW